MKSYKGYESISLNKYDNGLEDNACAYVGYHCLRRLHKKLRIF